MIKTTLKEIKRVSHFQGRKEFKEFLAKNGLVVKVNTTNQSSWNYSVRNRDFGLS